MLASEELREGCGLEGQRRSQGSLQVWRPGAGKKEEQEAVNWGLRFPRENSHQLLMRPWGLPWPWRGGAKVIGNQGILEWTYRWNNVWNI